MLLKSVFGPLPNAICFWGVSLILHGLATPALSATALQDDLMESNVSSRELTVPVPMRELQREAIETKSAAWGHWGRRPEVYSEWTNHSNRLIPIYIFGANLERYRGDNSRYRQENLLRETFFQIPEETLNLQVDYLDQTDIYRLQCDAVAAGKKNVFVLIFDGMDWQTTWAAAIYKKREVGYRAGRGTGLAFQDYQKAPTDFGWMVTSAIRGDGKLDVDRQTVVPDEPNLGGYAASLGGPTPWAGAVSLDYLSGQFRGLKHKVTDSASSATSMFAGIKTYNAAINRDLTGAIVVPLPRQLQMQGWQIGVVTSVPISHATPASTYASNVSRDDYQDLSRDLVGLPSVSHPEGLPGVDVLIGAGWGVQKDDDIAKQGLNFVPGNRYFADSDREGLQAGPEPRYRVVQRSKGQAGAKLLAKAASEAAERRQRLLGFFGTRYGHFPYRTADGDYRPARGASEIEVYEAGDVEENPTLADCTAAALQVLQAREGAGRWLMVEAGDVDWANHNNNLDDSIGAVLSGEAAFEVLVNWVETHSNWDESVIIVTADHGHLFNLLQPEVIAAAAQLPESKTPAAESDR